MNDARSVQRARVTTVRQGATVVRDDRVAVEEPLEIRLRWGPRGGRVEANLGLTMRTPGRDEALTAGLLVAEGIVHRRRDLVRFRHAPDRDGHPDVNALIVELAQGVTYDAASWARSSVRSSACGVCGRATLDALAAHRPHARPPVAVTDAALRRLPAALGEAQRIFKATGGLHAAALFGANGSILALEEDVGRHNAVDKLVGAAFLSRTFPPRGRGLVVSGRAGYEILQKAAMAGVGTVAALGAPSSLAIDVAKEAGITLVGFLRHDGYNVYAGAVRKGGRSRITLTRQS